MQVQSKITTNDSLASWQRQPFDFLPEKLSFSQELYHPHSPYAFQQPNCWKEVEAEKKMGEKKKAKAVIVGGSIAGVSCAHALISAGWDVVVLEKSSQPPKGSPTGAGLALDRQAFNIIESWLPQPQLLQQTTLPLTIDQVCTNS